MTRNFTARSVKRTKVFMQRNSIGIPFMLHQRNLYSRASSDCNFFVTTPIFYVNASPHIGHLYSAVIADTAQRFQKLTKDGKTFLSSGTDEHGSKIETAAGSINPQDYCDNMSREYKEMLELYDVDCNNFVRTSSKQHKKAVHTFWNKLEARGFLYKGEYSGWYCTADEAFVPESRVSVTKDNLKVSTESGRPVEWTEEKNYLFRLTKCKDDLLHWLKDDNIVVPTKFQKLLLTWVHEDLDDVSVSRPCTRVAWGITVPNDPSHTIYVWFDALINYLTAIGFPNEELVKWPPDLHVLGKDILRFHGLLWPSLLLAAGFEPPRKLLCHSHWLVNGEKMSKSAQNVINPCSKSSASLTPSGLRYFLLREGVAHSDGNYNERKACHILNSELADKYGNLFSRCAGASLNPRKVWPALTIESEKILYGAAAELIAQLTTLPDIARSHYEAYNFYKVIDSVIAVLQEANKFFETQKPWTLPKDGIQLATVLSLTMETLRVCSIILQPVIPKLSASLLDKLAVEKDARSWSALSKLLWTHLPTREIKLQSGNNMLFQRLVVK